MSHEDFINSFLDYSPDLSVEEKICAAFGLASRQRRNPAAPLERIFLPGKNWIVAGHAGTNFGTYLN